MKKILTFIPLGIGISAAIIYIFNVISFRPISNSTMLMQILSNLKIYLYISIFGFVLYFFIKALLFMNKKKVVKENMEIEDWGIEEVTKDEVSKDVVKIGEDISEEQFVQSTAKNTHQPLKFNNKNVNRSEEDFTEVSLPYERHIIYEDNDNKSAVKKTYKYCTNCGEELFISDKYCSNCGVSQEVKKKNASPVVRNIINVLEIVILILIIYFSVNMLFDYKEKIDPNFKSPFKVSMTK